MQPVEKQPDEAVGHAEAAGKKIDAAVKKAEDAEKRLRTAEDGPLAAMGAPDPFVTDTDMPGAAAGGPG